MTSKRDRKTTALAYGLWSFAVFLMAILGGIQGISTTLYISLATFAMVLFLHARLIDLEAEVVVGE